MMPQRTDVLPARPDLARQFRDRRWLDDTRGLVAAAGLRADARQNVTHLAELVARFADWPTMRSRPGMALLQQLSGLSRATCQRWLRWLERAGALLVVEEGTTPRFAPDRLRPGDPNLAREWHLTRPVPVSEAPAHAYGGYPTADARGVPPAAGDGEDQDLEDRRSAPDSPSLAPPPWRAQASEWPPGQLPQRRREQLTAVQALQLHHMVLRRLSARRLRSILRPWFRARWLPADVLWSLDTAPDGSEHWHADRVRDPASWLEHRLSFWLDSAGQPLPPHNAELATAAAAHRAAQLAQRAERQRASAQVASVDVAGHAAAARAMLRQAATGRGTGAARPPTPPAELPGATAAGRRPA